MLLLVRCLLTCTLAHNTTCTVCQTESAYFSRNVDRHCAILVGRLLAEKNYLDITQSNAVYFPVYFDPHLVRLMLLHYLAKRANPE